jgi:predicted phosphohydrolase
MNYAWLTDPHFNFLEESKVIDFLLKLSKLNIDGLFITGDISTGPEIYRHLQLVEKLLQKPVYFILGNHDYYRSSFDKIDRLMEKIKKETSNLHYMTHSEPIKLAPGVGLIGQDGWYDSYWREPLTSLVFVWDWFFITDFRICFSNKERLELSRERAFENALQAEISLKKALKSYDTVYFLTHFPPWPDFDRWCQLFEKFWMPYNYSKIMASTLQDVMAQHPTKKLIVLAGHSHDRKVKQIAPNIILKTAEAGHGKCQLGEIFVL